MNVIYLLVGIGLLTLGGEALIRGALGIARKLNVSPVLTGLVIVGFGTSMPELVVSLDAVLSGQPDIAVGNVVGSNIGNILLILGLCALITPLVTTTSVLRRDATMMLIASALFMLLVAGGELLRWHGFLFLSTLGAYLCWAYLSERKLVAATTAPLSVQEASEIQAVPGAGKSVVYLLIGLTLLIVGARVLLLGAVALAQAFGVSEAVIGLTVVAVGTSLPELTVSIIAAIRRHADVAVGNIIGSNIFNLLGILGVATAASPLMVSPRVIAFDQWFMLGASVVLVGFLLTGKRLSRLEGCVLLAAYVTYIWLSF
ncbi:calcium/sodium antiporter [Salinibius halmophilus]|uniref:calcium/sodium antiporter n=1 Tax=Salinibius halmophilus TaxID=1853216 RepID=UPI000E66C60B|nr:calcium/sodium antiporter [Salinibius halmophilus]